jgi:hypothetical protein
MLQKTLVGLFVLAFTCGPHGAWAQSSDCEVETILEARDVPDGTLAIDGYGSMSEVSTIFVPITLDEGRYEVQVTRESDNLYLVEGQNIYLRTSMCMKMVTMKDAILDIGSSQYDFGTLYFLD